jgi:hypothetical protein
MKWLCFILITIVCLSPTHRTQAEVFLPGTQPEEGDIRIAKVRLCKSCHAKTPNGESDPFLSWQGGMMAQAARDPVFRAALAIANQDIKGVGEYCIRCHMPSGWLEGRSTKSDGSDLTRDDMHGVSCDACHRMIDPLSEEAKTTVKTPPPGYGNGMMVVRTGKIAFGPYPDSPPVKSHKTEKSEFHASGNLCGTCHDVSNPLAATDVKTQPPYEYGVIERTFSEWTLSDFSKGKDKRTCQSCHYPEVKGGGKASRQKSSPHRDYFVEHGPVGGSTWVQNAVLGLWDNSELDRAALSRAMRKADTLLKTAARLEISYPSSKKVTIRVTNLTGHKLPTGYPEGRRMWLNVKYLDRDGGILREDGQYDVVERMLSGNTTKVRTLVDPDSTRVYECLPGISEKQAAKHGKREGKSFHFVLNDYIVFDNRIPPKGFNKEAFKKHNCAPVGVEYADGQNWDDVVFDLPPKCQKVEATLMYQSVSWEYIKFLYEENKTDAWGKKLYSVWKSTDQCPPSIIATVSKAIP